MPVTDTTLAQPRTDALLRITQAIEAAATLDELMLLALNELTQLLAVAHGAVLQLVEDDATCQLVSEYPPQRPGEHSFALEACLELSQAVKNRQPLELVRGGANGSHEDPLRTLLSERGATTTLLVPLVTQDRVIGLLLLSATSQEHSFSSDAVSLARVLASPLASAIVALQTSESARRRSEELSTLNEIAAAVTSTLDTHEVYLLVIQRLNQYFKVDAGSILLLDDVGNLRFVMTIEGGEEKLQGVTVPMGQGVVGHVALTGQWEIVPDAQNDPRFYRKVSESLGYETRSILCVPMFAKGRVIGVIELLNKLNGNFTEDDANRLTRMAAFIGVALENARLFQQVTAARDRLAAILDSTADGIMMIDLAGVVASANPMAAALFESREERLVGQAIETLIDQLRQRSHEVTTRSWGDEDGDGRPLTMTEFELGGQSRRFVRYFRLPVRDAEGHPYGELALLRDITKEKELEQLRDDYTGMLVHDLRAPLTSVMNGITMIQRGLGGPVTDQQRELLEIAFQGSQTMLDLVNNLLDISKMEQGRLTLDPEPLVPYAVVDAAVERLGASARAREVKIVQELSMGLPTVEADRDTIVRVLQNLLDNALKFSSPRSSVIVGAHHHGGSAPPGAPQRAPAPEGDWLVIWVRDHGPGIPPAYHERIFEKFGQVRGRKVRGTGLGLTFCKLAVETHKGHIWLESEEGVGSVFALALPLGSSPLRDS